MTNIAKSVIPRSAHSLRQMPQLGFTMIELLVTISIAAIMMAIAVPSFQSFLLNSRLTGHTNDLVLGMAYARSEAVKRGVNVTVCASNDQATCSGDWEDGWIVRFINEDDEEVALEVHTAYTGTICGSAGAIVFNSSGFSVADAAFPFTFPFAFNLYDSRGVADGRRVEVSLQGRASTSTGATACS